MTTRRPTSPDYNDVVEAKNKKEKLTSKQQEAKKVEAEQIRKTVGDLSVDKALAQVSATNLTVSKALTSVSEQLVAQTQQLEAVAKMVELKKEELERLHGAHIVASEIDALVEDYEAKSSEFANELERMKTDNQRTREALAQATEDYQADVERARAQEESRYQHEISIKRQQAQDAWENELRAARLVERDRKETLVRDWANREAELKARETEIVTLRQQVAEFPAKLDAEVRKTESIVGNAVKRDYEHKMALAAKDAEAATKLSAQTIESLQKTIADQKVVIAALEQRLTAAEEKVSSIAGKALDASSSQKTLAEFSLLTSSSGRDGNSRQGKSA